MGSVWRERTALGLMWLEFGAGGLGELDLMGIRR